MMLFVATVLALVAASQAHIGFGGCPTVPTQKTVDVEKVSGSEGATSCLSGGKGYNATRCMFI